FVGAGSRVGSAGALLCGSSAVAQVPLPGNRVAGGVIVEFGDQAFAITGFTGGEVRFQLRAGGNVQQKRYEKHGTGEDNAWGCLAIQGHEIRIGAEKYVYNVKLYK